jgi:hypothetical protein
LFSVDKYGKNSVYKKKSSAIEKNRSLQENIRRNEKKTSAMEKNRSLQEKICRDGEFVRPVSKIRKY